MTRVMTVRPCPAHYNAKSTCQHKAVITYVILSKLLPIMYDASYDGDVPMKAKCTCKHRTVIT